MAKLKYWFKRLWCSLFGCVFDVRNLESCYDERTDACTFRNRCLRCGREHKCTIPFIDLLDYEPIRMED